MSGARWMSRASTPSAMSREHAGHGGFSRRSRRKGTWCRSDRSNCPQAWRPPANLATSENAESAPVVAAAAAATAAVEVLQCVVASSTRNATSVTRKAKRYGDGKYVRKGYAAFDQDVGPPTPPVPSPHRMDNRCSRCASAFNQDIGGWADITASSPDLRTAYSARETAFNQDIGGRFPQERQVAPSIIDMFTEASISAFNQDISAWDTPDATRRMTEGVVEISARASAGRSGASAVG